MIVYACKVQDCHGSKIKTTDRRAIFRHYITHLLSELEDAASSLGIETYHENRYSIINSLIDSSTVSEVQN